MLGRTQPGSSARLVGRNVRKGDELQHVAGPYCIQSHDELEDAERMSAGEHERAYERDPLSQSEDAEVDRHSASGHVDTL